MASYATGISLAVLSTLLDSFGLILQKRTHVRRLEKQQPVVENPLDPPAQEKTLVGDPLPPSDVISQSIASTFASEGTHNVAHHERKLSQRRLILEPLWIGGLGCLAVGSVLTLVSIKMIGQARTAATGVLTIGFNAVFARFLLQERFTLIDGLSLGTIATGLVVSAVFGSSSAEPALSNVQSINAILNRPIVYIATGIIAGIFLVNGLFIYYTGKRLGVRRRAEAILECVVRALNAGLLSGSTAMFCKCLACIFGHMISSKDVSDFRRFETYILAIGPILSLLLQLYFLNSGLKRFDSLLMIPIYQVFIVSVGVLWGYIFFDEARGMSSRNVTLFLVGCLISILGVSVLFLKPHRPVATETYSDSAASLNHIRFAAPPPSPALAPSGDGKDGHLELTLAIDTSPCGAECPAQGIQTLTIRRIGAADQSSPVSRSVKTDQNEIELVNLGKGECGNAWLVHA